MTETLSKEERLQCLATVMILRHLRGRPKSTKILESTNSRRTGFCLPLSEGAAPLAPSPLLFLSGARIPRLKTQDPRYPSPIRHDRPSHNAWWSATDPVPAQAPFVTIPLLDVPFVSHEPACQYEECKKSCPETPTRNPALDRG